MDMNHNVRNAHTTSTRRAWRSPEHLLVGPDGLTAGDRLQALRIAAGYTSATAMAKKLGIAKVTYQHHENGARDISRRAISMYSQFFQVPPGYIMYGDEPPRRRRGAKPQSMVRVAGRIGRRGKIVPLEEDALQQFTPAPPFGAGNLEALIVDADDLRPVYCPGDVVFFPAPNPPSDALEGRECIVVTEDDRELLRICHRSPNGWTLTGYACKTLHNAKIKRAAPIAWVQRAALAAPT